MRKAVVLFLTLFLSINLVTICVNADEKVFYGNFEPITFSVGLGSNEKLLNGISAVDPYTKEDITENVEILGSIDFNTVGVYNVSYSVVDSMGKSWGELRKVSVVALDSDVEYINIDHGRNYLESIDFEMIKNTDFELHYLLYAENYEKLLYSWSFEGADIYNPPRRMSVTITKDSPNYQIIKENVGYANFQILNFEYKERFPSKAEIFFAVDETFNKDSSLYLYSYGETEGFKLIADGIVINDVYYASCFFEKGGEYVLTDKKVGYSNNTLPQFSSSVDNESSKPIDNNSGTEINPNFNESNIDVSHSEEIFNELQNNIYFATLVTFVAVVVVAAVVFVVSSKKSR